MWCAARANCVPRLYARRRVKPTDRSWRNGRMLFASVRNYPAGMRQKAHAHAETTITMVLTGSLLERVANKDEQARALSVVIKPRDTEHSDHFLTPVTTLQIVVSEPDDEDLRHAQPAMRAWSWRHAAPPVRSFLELLRVVRSDDSPDKVRRVEQATVEALASLEQNGAATAPGSPPQWLTRVSEEVDDCTRLPSVRALAASAGVHPVYLARQFRRWYGCSITEHCRHARLRRGIDRIVMKAGSLSEVAVDADFADHAHMCRLFRREIGMTPSMYRHLVSAVPTVQDGSASRN